MSVRPPSTHSLEGDGASERGQRVRAAFSAALRPTVRDGLASPRAPARRPRRNRPRQPRPLRRQGRGDGQQPLVLRDQVRAAETAEAGGDERRARGQNAVAPAVRLGGPSGDESASSVDARKGAVDSRGKEGRRRGLVNETEGGTREADRRTRRPCRSSPRDAGRGGRGSRTRSG